MDAFILAAGLGLRARPLSQVRPKPLFPLGGIPLIRLLLQQLENHGVRTVSVNLHHLSDQIRSSLRDRSKIRFIQERRLSGSRILFSARNACAEPLLVINGDVYLELPYRALQLAYNEMDCDGVLLVRRRVSHEYASVETENGWFCHTRPPGESGDLMYCGVALFSRKVLACIQDGSFFNSLERNALRIRVLNYPGIWLDLGTPPLYFQAHAAYLRHRGLPASAAFSPEVNISAGSTLENCIVWNGAEISAGSRLHNVIVTDGVRLSGVTAANRIITQDGIFPL